MCMCASIHACWYIKRVHPVCVANYNYYLSHLQENSVYRFIKRNKCRNADEVCMHIMNTNALIIEYP